LARLPEFKTLRDELAAKEVPNEEEQNLLRTVNVLINYFQTDYAGTIASIDNFKTHGEITFDLLWSVFLPRQIVLRKNPLSGDLEALRLIATKGSDLGHSLTLEGVDVGSGDDTADFAPYMKTQKTLSIPVFGGVLKVTSLPVYPISYHPDQIQLQERIMRRAKKWAAIAGRLQHVHYRGTAGVRTHGELYFKYTVSSHYGLCILPVSTLITFR